MTLTLGSEVESLTIRLTVDADFVTGLDSEDGDWPDGATIRLEFNDSDETTWDATVNAAAADWNVDKAEVNALIDRFTSTPRARLLYIDGTADLTWAQGTVVVKKW